jgi:MFS transporter, ACS family, D-galactonate transporter
VKWVGRIGILLWGVASLMTAFAGGFRGIFAARVLLGIVEAPSYSMNAKATGYWFPRAERGLATAVFDGAGKFSNVIGVPLVAVSIVWLGWRGAFVSTALVSFVFLAAFWAIYREPSEDPRLGPTERAYIAAGGASPEGRPPVPIGTMLLYAITRRKVWGLTLGFASYGYCFSMFVNWLPGYLVATMHMSVLKSATFTIIPWSCATIADVVAGGWLIDWFIRRGHDETAVRKTILIAGMVTGTAVFGTAFTTSTRWALVWVTISLCGLATAAPAGWAIPSLIAPRGGTGTVGSIMNCVNATMGVISPIVTGYIVAVTGSFSGAFLVAGTVLAFGIGCYAFLLGRIQPLPDPVPWRDAPALVGGDRT